MSALIIVALLGCTLLLLLYLVVSRASAQKKFIEQYQFPDAINEKVLSVYPHLSKQQALLVLEGLKSYFLVCHKAKGKVVAMPSQVVDVAWHEFLLYTREYHGFCRKAFGRFLHHTPTQAMSDQQTAGQALKRAWSLTCALNYIDPKSPSKIPLLFALDDMLDIDDGFKYALECDQLAGNSKKQCVSNIACMASSGADGSSADSVGCGGCGSS